MKYSILHTIGKERRQGFDNSKKNEEFGFELKFMAK